MADNLDSAAEEQILTTKKFFENVPPGQDTPIAELVKKGFSNTHHLILPELKLYCDDDACEGFRLFEPTASHDLSKGGQHFFVRYTCKNCGKSGKTYAIWAWLHDDGKSGTIYKYGETPEFGPPTPPKVVSILGMEKDYYFKGRRSENQGLGIAAFAYYRRVVENQKNKIFDEIIRTVKTVDSGNSVLLKELEDAKKEAQFTKAVGAIRHGIPQALLIDGHNPLTLLHAALSDGLHAKTDEECLEFATSVRVILTELVERMSNAVKDSAELKSAVSKILQKIKPTAK